MFSKTNLETRDRFADNYIDSREFMSPLERNRHQQFVNTNTLSSAKILPPGSKISNLIETEDQFSPQSKIIPLVSASDGTFHFHDDAANVLNRYSHRQIVFIGIWGSYSGEKSYFYDKILNLCGIQDAKYSDALLKGSQDYNMTFYERPFIKDNMRIFLIDCRGYNDSERLRKSQKIQLDILMSICEIIILVETPPGQTGENRDIIDIGYDHFNESFHRLYVNKAQSSDEYLPVNSISWPKSLFVLYSDTDSIKKHQQISEKQQDLRNMFSDFNFSLLHTNSVLQRKKSLQTYITINNPLDELYLKNSQSIFVTIYNKLQPKVFHTLKCTGFTAPLMIMQLVTSLNSHNSIFLPRVIQKVKRNVYGQVYNKSALNYVIKLKEYIKEEKAYSDKFLLSAFQQVHEQIMEEWDWNYEEIVTKKKKDQLYELYEEKLQKYIEEKQKNLLSINYKKSTEQLAGNKGDKLKSYKTLQSYSKFAQVKNQHEYNQDKYDSTAEAFSIGNALKTIYSQKNPIEQQKDQIHYAQYQQKQRLLQTKKQQLGSIIQSKMNIKQQLRSQFTQEQDNLLQQEKQIEKGINKYQIMLVNLQNNKNAEQNDDHYNKNSIKQMQQELQTKKMELKEQLNTSIMVRNRLINESQKNIMEKSKIISTEIDDKKKKTDSLMKSIFQSKVKFYTTHKIAERRNIDTRQIKKSRFV